MRLSLRWTLILYLAGLQLLAVGAILAPSYVNSERTLLDHARRLMRDVAFNTIAHANQFLAPAESAAELSKRLAENEIVARDDPDLLEKLLYEQLKLTPQFAGIYYGDERGDFVYVMRAAKDAPAQFRTKLMRRAGDGVDTRYVWRDGDFRAVETRADPADRYDPRERPWYVGAKAKGVTTWTDPYIFYSSRNPGVTVASPIFDSAGKLNGVVGVDIEIGAISDFLARLKIGEHGVALIMNHNGDVIAHPKQELIKTEKSDGSGGMRFTNIGEIADPIARSAFAPLVVDGAVAVSSKEMAFDERGVARYIATTFEHDGAEYVSTIAPMATATHPWIIGVYAPKDDFIGAIKRDRNRSIMIAIAVAAVTAAIGAWLANLIHKPVRALADRATRISRGRIVPAASLPSTFIELDRAVAAFNRMSIWLAGYREKNTELNESLRASSEALEARVKERTAELGQVNRRLHEEIAVRAATEKTLKDEAALHAHTSERLREAIEEARRANAAKSRFLSSMSHELRSPLNAIIGFTELLDQRGDILSHEKKQDYLNHVRSSGEHLLALVNDVLDLENVESGKILLAMEALDPRQAIGTAIGEQSAPAANKRIKVIDETSGMRLPHVYADAKRLRQILVNLLSNAIKYTDAGGVVTVAAEPRGPSLRISVADTGKGIPAEMHGRLFSPFDRLGAEATEIEGTGVGLALAKQLIESMGGEIGFRSAAGEGSVFWIEMPASRGATGEAPAPEAPPPEAPKRILYIDDDAAGLKFVADYMDGRADVAMTGADRAAAGLARARAEPFDLILVNPETRDAAGVNLVANLRRAQPGVAILAVAPDDAAVELADRFDGYVGRPARLLNLEREIAQRLRQLG